jgi:hypothetical protein
LDNSVQASGRVVAPLAAASLASMSIAGAAGYRGVFVGAAGVYALIAVAAALVVRAAGRRGAAGG